MKEQQEKIDEQYKLDETNQQKKMIWEKMDEQHKLDEMNQQQDKVNKQRKYPGISNN